jgi:hypothetical protein
MEARAWLVDLACRKAPGLGYPHEVWTTRLLARHAREHCVVAGHGCLADVVQGTVCKILDAEERPAAGSPSSAPGASSSSSRLKDGLWLNLVEGFFSKLARSVLRHIRVTSKQELKERLLAAIDQINHNPIVHTWTYIAFSRNCRSAGRAACRGANHRSWRFPTEGEATAAAWGGYKTFRFSNTATLGNVATEMASHGCRHRLSRRPRQPPFDILKTTTMRRGAFIVMLGAGGIALYDHFFTGSANDRS